MVRRTSKTLKHLVEKLCFKLPVVVLFGKGHDTRVSELVELAKMEVWCHITHREACRMAVARTVSVNDRLTYIRVQVFPGKIPVLLLGR